MIRHIRIQDESGNDMSCLLLIRGLQQKVEMRILFEYPPERPDMHILQHGLIIADPGQFCFALDFKLIIGSFYA
jgi:hypothetical protein